MHTEEQILVEHILLKTCPSMEARIDVVLRLKLPMTDQMLDGQRRVLTTTFACAVLLQTKAVITTLLSPFQAKVWGSTNAQNSMAWAVNLQCNY